MKKSHSIEMTEGSSLKNIILFALPLIATNLLQVLYTAADTVIVGLSSEADAVGAIGTTTPLINLIINIFIGCAVGAKVSAAVSLGEKNVKKTEETIHTSILISIIFGILCAAIGFLTSHPILKAMGNSGKLLSLSDLYAKIYFLGAPFVSATNFAIAIIHASGDTKTPMKILLSTGLLHIILNLIFVLIFNMSVEGMALATIISNFVSAVVLLKQINKINEYTGFSLKKLHINKNALKSILHIGLPAGIQSALFSLSHLVIQSSIVSVNNMTVPKGSEFAPVVKGNAVSANIESFGFTLANSIAQAAISFTGQNVGAKKYERIKKIALTCYFTVFISAILFSCTVLTLRNPILSIYSIKSDTESLLNQIAYDTAVKRMLFMFIPYFLLGFMEVGSGILQGLGRSVTSTVVSVTGSVVFRIVWIAIVFRHIPTLEIVYLSYPISWFMTSLTHFIFIHHNLGKLSK